MAHPFRESSNGANISSYRSLLLKSPHTASNEIQRSYFRWSTSQAMPKIHSICNKPLIPEHVQPTLMS
jgi:hypothetical protein